MTTSLTFIPLGGVSGSFYCFSNRIMPSGESSD